MNKLVYISLSILEINKIAMYEFSYDYMKTKYGEKTKLCYVDTDSFIVYTKTEDIYLRYAKGVEARFDTSVCELERPLLRRKNEKVIGLIKDELGGKIMTDFAPF